MNKLKIEKKDEKNFNKALYVRTINKDWSYPLKQSELQSDLYLLFLSLYI